MQGNSISGFRTIGNYSKEQVQDLVKRVCANIGKPWDTLDESEKDLYLTLGANTLANRPTILAQTADLPDLASLDLNHFHQVFVQGMRTLPGWSDSVYFAGFPIDGVKQAFGGTRTGTSVDTNQQQPRG